MSRPRVVHVISGLGLGGAERFLLRLVTHPAMAGWEHHVVSLTGGGDIAPRLAAAGIEVVSVAEHEADGGWQRLIRVRRLVRALAPAVMHGWMYHGALATLAGSWGQRPRVPVVWGIRTVLDPGAGHRWPTRMVIRLGGLFSRFPRAIVYNSQAGLASHVAGGFEPSRAMVIPNGLASTPARLSLDARRRLQASLAVPEGTAVLLHVARAHPVKGHIMLLEAMRNLTQQRSNLVLLMVGEGVDRGTPWLDSAVRASLLEPHVRLLGPRDDIEALMGFADVVVCPSNAEGFPNVVLEAMAAGSRIVATDVGDTAAMLDGMGWVVPPRDAASLAAGVEAALRLSPTECDDLATRLRERVVAHYGLESCARRYAALYQACQSRDGAS